MGLVINLIKPDNISLLSFASLVTIGGVVYVLLLLLFKAISSKEIMFIKKTIGI